MVRFICIITEKCYQEQNLNRVKYLNFIAINIKNVVSVIASLLSVSIISRGLGLGAYAEIAAILAVLGGLGLLGNAVVDACVKSVLGKKGINNSDDISSYLKTAILVILIFFCIFLLIYSICYLGLYKAKNFEAYTIFFIFAMSAFFSLIGGVFRVGAFMTERHLSQSLMFILSKVIYVIGLYYGLSYWNNGIVTIGIFSFLSSLLLSIMYYIDLKIQIPGVGLLNTSLKSSYFYDLFGSIGYMLAVYIGLYLSSSSALIMVKYMHDGNQNLLINIALAGSISSIVYQLLTSYSYIVVPRIHKHIEAKNEGAAIAELNRSSISILYTLIVGVLILKLIGSSVLSFWLGTDIEPDSIILITIACGSVGFTAIGIQWSHYYASKGQIRQFGILTILEGLSVTLVSFICIEQKIMNEGIILVSLPLAAFIIKLIWISKITGSYKYMKLDLKQFFLNLAIIGLILLSVNNLPGQLSVINLIIYMLLLICSAFFNLKTLR